MASTLSSLATLLKQTHINDDEEVLRAANAALKQSKSDLEAQHVKLVALLKLDRYEEALQVLDTGGRPLQDRARLEHAYALYKAGDPTEAVAVANRGAAERGLQHVEAQAQYRLEHFERAAALYREFDARPDADGAADLRTNGAAVDAQLEWAGRGDLVRRKQPGREDLEELETAYNAACGSIARGELGQAEVLLRRATDLCNAMEDLSEEEKKIELIPVIVQHIYVLTRLGRLDEAETLARGVDVKALPDNSTKHIAQLNVAVASATSSNPFLLQRLVTQDPPSSKSDYPFNYQSALLRENRYASDLQSLKFGGTADSTHQTLSKQPSSTTDAFLNTLSVVNAAAHARNQTGKESLKYILPIIEKRPLDVGLILTVAQLYVLTGNATAAINLLEKFLTKLEQSGHDGDQDVRFAPGLVGTLISFYERQGRKSHVRKEFANAAAYWRRKPNERPSGVIHFLKAAGASLLESEEQEHQQLAQEVFSELHQRDASDRYVAAGLLAASPQEASDSQLSSLTPIGRLVAGVDIDALEKAGIAQPAVSGAVTTSRKRPAEDGKPKKAKKIRQNRLPKNYDPSKTPDPERWLPLRDRSTYRPKGKKGKARQALLSQGAVANDSDGSRPATPGTEVLKQKQGGGGGGANKKKKGKGGKW